MIPVAEFKKMTAPQQRKAIADMVANINVGDADMVAWWVGEYAPDLLDEKSSLKLAFDVWYVTTKVYDVDLPNDVCECVVDGDDVKHWRRMVDRHGLTWSKFTRAQLADMGIES